MEDQWLHSIFEIRHAGNASHDGFAISPNQMAISRCLCPRTKQIKRFKDNNKRQRKYRKTTGLRASGCVNTTKSFTQLHLNAFHNIFVCLCERRASHTAPAQAKACGLLSCPHLPTRVRSFNRSMKAKSNVLMCDAVFKVFHIPHNLRRSPCIDDNDDDIVSLVKCFHTHQREPLRVCDMRRRTQRERERLPFGPIAHTIIM